MIQLASPWLLLAIILPLIYRYLLPPKLVLEQAALKVPFLEDFDQFEHSVISQQKKWPVILASIAWVLLVFACARPQWLGEPIEQAVSGRDLMLAVDVSGSMKEKDFVLNGQQIDRLSATKHVASEFIQRRIGDRLGLILFGTTAYLQTPLTFDRQTVATLLKESFIGITDDEPATSIGDAIGVAVKHLKNEQTNSRVLVLLTDGANTAGTSPIRAAQLAADHQLKIYTIGIGADEMLVRSLFGNRTYNPSRDLDEKMLNAIADKTQGRYFRARNKEQLDAIYQLLDELEPVEKDKQFYRPMTELYHWPLALALLLAAGVAVSRLRFK
ncbi:MAG: VWA domain-containing protein [Cycloclasticus sp.]|nr:VWA domain-containing protein [Cycloclasticus sp.]